VFTGALVVVVLAGKKEGVGGSSWGMNRNETSIWSVVLIGISDHTTQRRL
jgi:hypothetical protein